MNKENKENKEIEIRVSLGGDGSQTYIYDSIESFEKDYNILTSINYENVAGARVYHTMKMDYELLTIIYKSGREREFIRVSPFNNDYQELIIR